MSGSDHAQPRPPDPAGAGSELEAAWRRFRWLAAILVVGSAAAWTFHWVLGAVLRLPHPWSSFLFVPQDRFSDLTDTWIQARAADPYHATLPACAAYFPLVYRALALARGFSRPILVGVWLGVTVLALTAVWAVWARDERRRWGGDPRWQVVAWFTLAACLLNYPVLFAIDRGNFDPIIVSALALAIALLDRGRGAAGALLLGVSAAAKGWSFAGILLWAKRRAWGSALVAALALALGVLVPAALLGGGLGSTLQGMREGLACFRAQYVYGPKSMHFSADVINGVRVALAFLGRSVDSRPLVVAYERVAVAWAALLAVHVVLFARTRSRELLGIALLMLVFPNVTSDYKLVLLVPVVLAWLSEGFGGWRDRLFAICAGALLVPKHYLFIRSADEELARASLSCVVSPLLLVGLSAALWPDAEEIAAARAAWGRVRGGATSGSTAAGG